MTTKTAKVLHLVAAASATFALTACSSSSNGKAASTTAADSATTTTESMTTTTAGSNNAANIVIKTFQFSPSPATVSGGTIVVRNDDNTTHTITSDEADLFNVVLNGPGASESVTIPVGTHKYHCEIHPSMTGVITVS